MKFANAALVAAGFLFAGSAMAADYTIRLASSLSPGEPTIEAAEFFADEVAQKNKKLIPQLKFDASPSG